MYICCDSNETQYENCLCATKFVQTRFTSMGKSALVSTKHRRLVSSINNDKRKLT